MIDSTREQKRTELEQKIKAMRLMDDNFMTAVLSDKACAELVIRIILRYIEIQRSDCGATPKHTRYISSMIDADTLLSSENYDELPETYVIFITKNDILRQSKPLYVIDRNIVDELSKRTRI